MSKKHTPGPWYPTSAGIVCKDIGDLQHDIATCADWSEETEANARLIAAAPELLEALEPFGAIDLIESRLPAEFAMLVLRARAAIAKATGE